MKPEIISTIAAAASALAAILTLYMYRSQGKGFVWTKDPKVTIGVTPDKTMMIRVEIPLYNFGNGNLRFLSLNAKKIFLRNNSIEPFKLNMDEAYFPPSVPIITYKTSAFSNIKKSNGDNPPRVYVVNADPNPKVDIEEQDLINKNLSDMGEVLFILQCKYKDGSWLGFGVRTTTIAMSLKDVNLNYLSIERRKELNELFQF